VSNHIVGKYPHDILKMKSEESDNGVREIRGYRILKPIGQGKFSIVYKAERIGDNMPVAMKMIKVFYM